MPPKVIGFDVVTYLFLITGKCATHGVVYAKLITPDGADHGLHAFVVPIRNVLTLLPFPGVVVGDLGEKIEVNGVDNGFVMFQNYRIPRENLLNKTGDVSPEGKYVSPIKDPRKRLGKVFILLALIVYLHSENIV